MKKELRILDVNKINFTREMKVEAKLAEIYL